MISDSNYNICVNCVMDTSDPGISFDSHGLCDYCRNYKENILPIWASALESDDAISKLAQKISRDGRGKDFDCIIGLSGGLDSSYAAYVAKEKMGLRPLLFHVDAGWNTDQAVENIERLVDGLELDLYTDVVEWGEVREMQKAFLFSGIPDQDLVQDAAFFSGLYKFARKYNIKHIITGSNYSNECCREPEAWGGYLGIDKTLFEDIWCKHGPQKTKSEFPLVDIFVYKIYFQKILRMKVHHPLNLVKFVKTEAEQELKSKFGWKKFQHKHHESRFTRFYEDFWLPRRFGYEKRRAHFSSLILTGQMSRDEALKRLEKPEMSEDFLQKEFKFVASKLGLSVHELKQCFEMPTATYRDFKNKRRFIGMGTSVLRRLGLEKRYFR